MYKFIDPELPIHKQITCDELTELTGHEHELERGRYPRANIRGTIVQLHESYYMIRWSRLQNEEIRKNLVDLMGSNDFTQIQTNSEQRIKFTGHEDFLSGYASFLEVFETCTIEGLSEPKPEYLSNTLARDKGKFYASAKAIYILVNEGLGGFLTGNARRILDCDQTGVMKGKQCDLGDEKTRREHVVPCLFIVKESAKMSADTNSKNDMNDTIKKIAEFIEDCLEVIEISKDKQEELDSEYQVTMPGNWVWGEDCNYARLHHVNVEFRGKNGELLCDC